MNFFFFLKPIADMLYQFQILDWILCFLCILFVLKKKIRTLCDIDLCVLALMILFFFSYFRNWGGWVAWIKIESSFLIYFLGRAYYRTWDSYMPSLCKGFLIILVISLLSFLTGAGYKQWGSVHTLTGFYFFKTDMAAALAQCFLLYSIIYSFRKKTHFILIVCFLLTLLTNARMYYFIIAFLLGIYYLYNREIKTGKRIKLSGRIFTLGLFLIVILLLLFNFLGETILGDEYLLFKLDSASDLMSESNTQGRSVAWANIYGYFAKQDFFTRLIGVNLVKDAELGIICESHNTYLKILFSIGYLGSVVFLMFIGYVIKYLNKLKSAKLFYLGCGFFCIYLLSGLSYTSIMSTQLTWLPMFFIGVCVSESQLVIIKKQNY